MPISLPRLAILAFLSFSGAASAQGVQDHLGVGERLSFGGMEYRLAWSAATQPGYVKQEYIPEGQSLQSWTEMLIVEVLQGEITSDQAAGAQAQRLDGMVGQDPLLRMELSRISTDEYVMQFMLSDLARAEPVAEWNAYRYAPLPGEQPGVALFGVARRGYGAGIERFVAGIDALAPGIVAEVSSMRLPVPQIGGGAQPQLK